VNGGALEANGVSCGSLSTIDSLTADVSSKSSTSVVFDLSNGALGPGFTDEGNGSSEIEFDVVGQSSVGTIRVDGSPGNDTITVGHDGTGLINLDAGADGATPDADVVFSVAPFQVVLAGQGGDDVLSANGIVDGVMPYNSEARLNGGTGTNQLVGGAGGDVLEIRTEVTSTGTDTVTGGNGFDRLFISTDSTTLKSTYSLDDVANDGVGCPGLTCERDNVASDVDAVSGSLAAETLIGRNSSDALFGGGGNDVLRGLAGADNLLCSGGKAIGGAGGDYITADPGCKRVGGGSGSDTVTFGNVSQGVSVSLDDMANDGQPGSLMNVGSDIENISGSSYRDTLVGSDKRNLLQGWNGADTLVGGGGNDRLEGFKGSDTLTGGLGDDTLVGGAGNDDLDGGEGIDDCRQGAGTGSEMNCD
jgi:Ca2+-binding RTX toxin-like protein